MVQCDTGRIVYVSDSITPVLNQSQVSLIKFVDMCHLPLVSSYLVILL